MMAAAQKAVELDPDDGKTHLALGGAYAYQGKAEQAIAEFDRAETLSPSDADLLLVIAWTIPAFGESERAVSLAEKALKLNPHYPDWYNQGLSLVFFLVSNTTSRRSIDCSSRSPLHSTMPSWPWLMRIWDARVMRRQLPPTSKSWIRPGLQNDILARRAAMRRRRPSCLSMVRGWPDFRLACLPTSSSRCPI